MVKERSRAHAAEATVVIAGAPPEVTGVDLPVVPKNLIVESESINE